MMQKQRHNKPSRNMWGQRVRQRPSVLHKAEKEKRERADRVIALLGLSLLYKVIEGLEKPIQPPPQPREPDIIPDDITDAEFYEI
ncbi:MAG: hypothetical protein KAR20_13800 [Candidatus Heimdallarchaeota archaeon]|nr:hypothetical protein [Candidatus Heimdallarchaeota archaeon]